MDAREGKSGTWMCRTINYEDVPDYRLSAKIDISAHKCYDKASERRISAVGDKSPKKDVKAPKKDIKEKRRVKQEKQATKKNISA